MFSRAWNSPTLTTWASFAFRSLGLALVLPLALQKLTVAEFNIWALLSMLLGLQLLVDMGFCVTFVRAIAYALAGVRDLDAFQRDSRPAEFAVPNWELVSRIGGVMRYMYQRLAWLFLLLLVIGGTAALWRPISLTDNPWHAWSAWAIVALTGYANLRGNYLSVFLQGLNEISVLRRWEAITSLGSVLSAFLALHFGGGLLGVVAATQPWSLMAVLRNRWLCGRVHDGRFACFPSAQKEAGLLAALWPATWRSGLGVVMSFGVVQSTGLINAQIASAADSASYLLCLRLLQLTSIFSQAPFYSKLSLLPRLRAQGHLAAMIKVAQRGMSLSLWTYAVGFMLGGLLGPWLLLAIHSRVPFPSISFWIILGLSFFFERFGAMHLNLYSTTNHIISHIANGGAGALSIGSALMLAPWIGAFALPACLLIGNLGFYSWYPPLHSYRAFGLHFPAFEVQTSLGPLLLLLLAATAMLALR